MATLSPKIDERDQLTLINQLSVLIKSYVTEWRDSNSLESDPQAQTLIQIFVRMMEILIQRLNRVPEKNFLSFLDLIGVYLAPPRVAQVPLTFMMATGAKQSGFIPAGTQVASEQDQTIVFETEKDLTVILPRLTKSVSLDPLHDQWSDHSEALLANPSRTGVELFRGKELIPHRLYIGHQNRFGFKEPVTVALNITLAVPSEIDPENWKVKWYCFQGEQRISLAPFGVNQQGEADQNVANLLQSGTLYFPYLCNVSGAVLQGVESSSQEIKNWKNNWIVAQLQTPISGISVNQLPEIQKITAGIEINTPAVVASGTIYSQETKVFGVKTKFSQLKKDDRIIAQSQIREIIEVDTVNEQLTIDSGFEPDLPEGTTFTFTPRATGTIAYEKTVETGGGTNKVYVYKYAGTNFAAEIKEGQFIIVDGETRVIVDAQVQLNANEFAVNQLFNQTLAPPTSFYYAPPAPGIPVDAAFANHSPLDVSKDFLPFGERPKKLMDTFHLASKEVFSKKGATVTLKVQLSEGVQVTTEGVKLRFEYWNGIAWDCLGEIAIGSCRSTYENSKFSFIDSTNAFTASQRISFIVPELEPIKINEVENYWLRVRIIDGGYGSPAQYYEQTVQGHYLVKIINGAKYKIVNNNPVALGTEATEWLITQETYQPPSIGSILLSYMMPLSPEAPEDLLTYNGFEYQEQTGANPNIQMAFSPFIPGSDEQSAVYLGFDQDIGDLPVNLFFHLLENKLYNTDISAPLRIPPVIAWEYWNGNGWNALHVEDGTRNLTKREMVEFLVPDNLTKRYLFETESYWIRVRLDKGIYEFLPKPWTISTNTVWAHHLTTMRNEILGSSNGNPNQSFKLVGAPVLPGQQILVHEPALTEADRKMVLEVEGKDAIHEVRDQAGNVVEIWVRWHEVNSFHFSQFKDGVYQIDRITVFLTFADAKRGMIPPIVQDNIKCAFYQYGGGSKGNIKAGALTKLRTTFPYIDSVRNLEAADGGFDQENLARALARGPQTLKHRDRAVTYEDFEWLVKEASTKIAKAKCLPTTDDRLQYRPGWVTVVIIPESDDPKPYPSQELIQTVEEYLFARTSSYLIQDPVQVNLVGPGYIGIAVEATVKYNSISAAKIIEGQIIERLKQFFHPLNGGDAGAGWDFGRNIFISEVYAAIEGIDGVDYVADLALKAAVQLYTLTIALTDQNSESGLYPQKSIVKTEDDKIAMLLTEALSLRAGITTVKLTVMGFKEGDRVQLVHQNGRVALVIKSVSNQNGEDILEFEPASANTIFPVGSVIERVDGWVRSYILNQVPEAGIIQFLKVAVFTGNDNITINHPNDQAKVKSGRIQTVALQSETIFIDSNYLVYSGNHVIHSEINTG